MQNIDFKAVESEASANLKRRFNLNLVDVLALMDSPDFAPGEDANGRELHAAIYRAADELLRRESLA